MNIFDGSEVKMNKQCMLCKSNNAVILFIQVCYFGEHIIYTFLFGETTCF